MNEATTVSAMSAPQQCSFTSAKGTLPIFSVWSKSSAIIKEIQHFGIAKVPHFGRIPVVLRFWLCLGVLVFSRVGFGFKWFFLVFSMVGFGFLGFEVVFLGFSNLVFGFCCFFLVSAIWYLFVFGFFWFQHWGFWFSAGLRVFQRVFSNASFFYGEGTIHNR